MVYMSGGKVQQEMRHQYVIVKTFVVALRRAVSHHVWVGIYRAMLI